MKRSTKSLHGLGLPRWWFHIVALALSLSYTEDLDCLELFDGAGQWTNGMLDVGYRTEGFDYINDPTQDLMTKDGLLCLIHKLLRLREGGLLNIAIPCGCWVWISRGRHKRTLYAPAGRPGQQSKWVFDNNNLASVVSYIILTAVAFGIHIMVENPKTSVIWRFFPIAGALGRVRARRVCISMGSFNGASEKHLIINGTPDWLLNLAWVSKSPKPSLKNKAYLCDITTQGGRTKVKGKPKCLMQSAMYTYEYGVVCGMLLRGDSRDDVAKWLLRRIGRG